MRTYSWLKLRQRFTGAPTWSTRARVARATGGSLAEARRLVVAGGLLAGAVAPGGSAGHGAVDGQGAVNGQGAVDGQGDALGSSATATPIAGFCGELARLVREGRVGVDVAALFSAAVLGLPDVERTRELFSRALAKAQGLPLHHVRRLVWRAQALADPRAWEDREQEQHDARSDTRTACSARPSASRSWNATAGARGATRRHRGARHIIFAGGNATRVQRTSPTECCCARDVTIASIATAGKSRCGIKWCTSYHRAPSALRALP